MHPRDGLRVLAPLLLSAIACSSASQLLLPMASPTPHVPPPSPTQVPASAPTTEPPPSPTETATATASPSALVPDFRHVVTVVFENKEYGTVIGNPEMPYFNELAESYTLLTQHYAVAHPSLPNYLALIGGDTFGVTFDCTKCIFDAVTLPDLIDASGATIFTASDCNMSVRLTDRPDRINSAIRRCQPSPAGNPALSKP